MNSGSLAGQIDALVCVKPGELRVEARPAPQCGVGEVLVRPLCVGICGTDYHIFEGKHPYLKYPRVMGHELAVEVVEVPGGSRLRQGEIYVVNPYLSCGVCIACRSGKPNCCVSISVLGVHQDGGMTTLFSLPEQNLVRAEGLSADQCAAVEFLAIGAHSVRRAAVSKDERVLVVGAGPIGLGVALFAGLSGGRVTMMDLDAERLNVAHDTLGVDGVVAGENSTAAIEEKTGGEGYGVVFDATGNVGSIEDGFDFVAPGGRYALVSVVKESITFRDPDFHRKEMSVLGCRNATLADFERVIDSIRNGRVPIDCLITHRTTLRDAVRDIPLWATRKNGLIKALILAS